MTAMNCAVDTGLLDPQVVLIEPRRRSAINEVHDPS
jgi:hypothetical protein